MQPRKINCSGTIEWVTRIFFKSTHRHTHTHQRRKPHKKPFTQYSLNHNLFSFRFWWGSYSCQNGRYLNALYVTRLSFELNLAQVMANGHFKCDRNRHTTKKIYYGYLFPLHWCVSPLVIDRVLCSSYHTSVFRTRAHQKVVNFFLFRSLFF